MVRERNQDFVKERVEPKSKMSCLKTASMGKRAEQRGIKDWSLKTTPLFVLMLSNFLILKQK